MNDLFSYLESSAFKEVAGARISARVPVAASLLNRVVSDALRARAPAIGAVDIRPRAGDRFDVVIKLTWPFVPPLTISVMIERQPDFPDSPVLLLRWSFLAGLGEVAARFTRVLDKLPAGLQMEGDRLAINLVTLAAQTAAAPLMRYINRVELHTIEDHAVVEVDLSVDARREPGAEGTPPRMAR